MSSEQILGGLAVFLTLLMVLACISSAVGHYLRTRQPPRSPR